MKRSLAAVSLLIAIPALVACSSTPPPEPPPAPAPAPDAPELPKATAAAEAPKPPEPTPEEKKKAEEQRELAADRAQWDTEHKAELARWTPELHAATKALAEKAYPNGKAALQAAMAGKHRAPTHADRDKYRHPIETFELLGFKPTMTVLEYSPGEGWVTELLAPSLAAKGKLIVTTSDANGPPDQRSTFYGQRLKQFLETSPEAYGKVQSVVVDGKAPKLGLAGTVDMAIVFRGMHGMVNNDKLGDWLAEIHDALKPNGILGVEQHRAKEGDDPKASAKKGYLPEKWLIEQIEKAGFSLAGKSEVNANPKDTKDYAEGVWTLPPTLRLKDKDRDKYLAIGESDRMTLKFKKVAKPAAKKDDKAASSPPPKADKPKAEPAKK